LLEEDFFQVGLFSIRVGLFLARGGLFSIGVGLFLVGGGLFLSPTVAEKSPTPAEKSPTAILKRCWTLEYFGELEFSSPFMEQWTLDARGGSTPWYRPARHGLYHPQLPHGAVLHHLLNLQKLKMLQVLYIGGSKVSQPDACVDVFGPRCSIKSTLDL